MAEPDTYIYRGRETLGFPDYVDRSTGTMLIAEPGGTYPIRAISGTFPVPPAGPWENPAPPPAPPLPVRTPKTSTPQGGE